MANGTLVFKYESLADLKEQIRVFLGDEEVMVPVPTVRLAHSSPPAPATPESVAGGTLGGASNLMTPKEQVFGQDTQLGPSYDDKAAEPTPEPAVHPEPQPAQASEMTLETLAAADHKTLVAFVDAHPEVGVTLTEFQRGNNIWRDFIAQKVKNWLESR